MNKHLLTFILVSATLACQAGNAADVVRPLGQPAAALAEALSAPPSAQLQFASIGGDVLSRPATSTRPAAQSAAAAAAPAEGLPSIPIALGCLVLIICILVSRRNPGDLID